MIYASSDRDIPYSRDIPYGSVAGSVTAARLAEAEADWLWGVVLREERRVDPKQVRYLRSRAWRRSCQRCGRCNCCGLNCR